MEGGLIFVHTVLSETLLFVCCMCVCLFVYLWMCVVRERDNRP